MSSLLVLVLLFIGTISAKFHPEQKFTVKQGSLLNAGRSYTITEGGSIAHGEDAIHFTIQNEWLSVGKKLVLLANGKPLYEFKHKLGHLRQEWHIYDAVSGDTIGLLKHHLSLIHDTYEVKSAKFGDLDINGKIGSHTFTIKKDGHQVAQVHKDRFHLHDEYTVKIEKDQDPAIFLLIAIGIDEVRKH